MRLRIGARWGAVRSRQRPPFNLLCDLRQIRNLSVAFCSPSVPWEGVARSDRKPPSLSHIWQMKARLPVETQHLVHRKEPHGLQTSMLMKWAVDVQGSCCKVATTSQRQQAFFPFSSEGSAGQGLLQHTRPWVAQSTWVNRSWDNFCHAINGRMHLVTITGDPICPVVL